MPVMMVLKVFKGRAGSLSSSKTQKVSLADTFLNDFNCELGEKLTAL